MSPLPLVIYQLNNYSSPSPSTGASPPLIASLSHANGQSPPWRRRGGTLTRSPGTSWWKRRGQIL